MKTTGCQAISWIHIHLDHARWNDSPQCAEGISKPWVVYASVIASTIHCDRLSSDTARPFAHHHSTQKLDRLPKTAWTVNVTSQKHWRGKLQSVCPLIHFMPPTRGAVSTLFEDLYTKPQTCCRCESVHLLVQLWLKILRAKKTASSSRRFKCHRLWDSSYSPEAGIPSHTTPQPWADASIVIIWRIWVASELRCGRDAQTSRSPRRSRNSRFQP